MNQNEFNTQMNRLVSQFGKAAYGVERTTLIWREVRDLPPEWFAGVVDEFLGSSRQAPLIPEFRDVAASERERMRGREQQERLAEVWNLNPRCDYCRDNGVYVCVRTDGGAGFYGFRCHCERGSSDPRRAIPQLKADHAKQFVYFDIVEHRRKMAGV